VHDTGGVVIRIEEISIFGNGIAIAGLPFFENERFEEPGRVREMPLGRTDVRHRLHNAIFRRKIFSKLRAEVSDFVKTREQILRGRRTFARARLRGRLSIFWSDRGLDQVIPPSCSISSRRASSI